jgi:hypothetical protein
VLYNAKISIINKMRMIVFHVVLLFSVFAGAKHSHGIMPQRLLSTPIANKLNGLNITREAIEHIGSLMEDFGENKRMKYLNDTSASAVLVHFHIQKAAGTALASSLTTSCDCKVKKVHGIKPGSVYDKVSCSKCPKATGGTTRTSFTVNRNTGWKCGTHMPLVRMFSCMARFTDGTDKDIDGKINWDQSKTSPSAHTVSEQIVPVHLVMLREPWSRFQSEVKHMAKSTSQKASGIADFHAPQPGRSRDAAVVPKGALPKRLAELPNSYIIQNRMLKMVGGSNNDFNFNYNVQKVGSRWSGGDDDEAMETLLIQSLRRLDRPDVLLLISDSFQESICHLEALYGHMYRFDWNAAQHSHALGGNTVKNMTLPVLRSDATYESWKRANSWDIAFYELATELFQRQVEALRTWLLGELQSGRRTKESVPHCFSPINILG